MVPIGQAERLGRGVVTVVPVTSQVERLYPFQVKPRRRRQVCVLTRRRKPNEFARSP